MLKEKKYFLFDIDGTLSVGTTLYDGTKEFLDWIEETGGRCFYITNNSTTKAEKIMWKICGVGHYHRRGTVYDRIVYACLYMKEHYEGKKGVRSGTPSFLEESSKPPTCR